jgi:signal transduction histidine kinase
VFDQCVTTIVRQVRLLRQIASEFSTFAGTPTPRFEPVALDAVVESIVAGYRTSDRVELDVDVGAALPAVRVDRTLLVRALTNIVENAVQAMPQGGTLTVRASAPAGSDRVTLTVRDTGVGMDPEAAARAFEPYFSTKTAGSGLGLPNAKRNIELCGGTIALESAPGAGTLVTIALPVADDGRAAG